MASSKGSKRDRIPDFTIIAVGEVSVKVNWEEYPDLRSPYMRLVQEDERSKLIIRDDKSGIIIDFDGLLVLFQDLDGRQ